MKVGLLPELVQVLHAARLLSDDKPLSKGTFSKAAVASRSLHSANLNETPIQSLLELPQQLFREIHLEVPRPAFTHAMRLVPQACRRGSGLKVSLSCSAADCTEHRVLRLSPLWHTRSLMSETCAGRRADLQQAGNQSAAAAPTEVGIRGEDYLDMYLCYELQWPQALSGLAKLVQFTELFTCTTCKTRSIRLLLSGSLSPGSFKKCLRRVGQGSSSLARCRSKMPKASTARLVHTLLLLITEGTRHHEAIGCLVGARNGSPAGCPRGFNKFATDHRFLHRCRA